MKPLCPDKKALEKRCEAAAFERFHVKIEDPALIKHWDLRMLATEQRDLMPQSESAQWADPENRSTNLPQPFDFEILPYLHPDNAAEAFLELFYRIAPDDAVIVAANAPKWSVAA